MYVMSGLDPVVKYTYVSLTSVDSTVGSLSTICRVPTCPVSLKYLFGFVNKGESDAKASTK